MLISLSNIFNKKDEICGQWTTEDGAGFMISMGSWIEFKRNGTGTFKRWRNDESGSKQETKGKFAWKRSDEDKISIQEVGTQKLEEFHYKIETSDSGESLCSVVDPFGEVKDDGFWNFGQVMFRI